MEDLPYILAKNVSERYAEMHLLRPEESSRIFFPLKSFNFFSIFSDVAQRTFGFLVRIFVAHLSKLHFSGREENFD